MIDAPCFTPNKYGPELEIELRKAGKQVAYYAISKGAMSDDEQWDYVTTQWPMMQTFACDKVLRYASAAIKDHFATAAQLLKDFA